MKPTVQHKEAHTSGGLETNQASIQMTPEMFDMLSSKVYQNKELAVVREIICNAKDAHVDAGVEKEVLVHLPNALEPWFSVRDYGTGLTHDQVMNLYLSYGLSTKTDSNDVIGGLGIGSKSPLAYTTSFTVESFHNGKRRIYNVYKDKGIPCVSKLHEEFTKEPNGLLVKVSIKNQDHRTFQQRTENFLAFFDYDVKVVGNTIEKPPELILDSTHYKVYKFDHRYGRATRALMGGVVYNISDEYTRQLQALNIPDTILLKFDIGDLTVAASRESLSEDNHTKDKIQDKVNKIIEAYKKDFQDKLDKLNKKDTILLLKSYNMITTKRQRHSNNIVRGIISEYSDLQYDGSNIDNLISLTGQKVKVHCRFNKPYESELYALIGNDVTFVRKDLKTNFNKVVTKILQTEPASKVVLLESHQVRYVTDLLGKDAKIRSCEAEKDRLFPHGVTADKISVPKSGVFDKGMNEITSLDTTQEGWYFPFERDYCLVQGFYSLDEIKGIMRYLTLFNDANNESLFKGNLYIVRKGGIKAIEKTKVKRIDAKTIVDMCKKVIAPEIKTITTNKIKFDVNIYIPIRSRGRLQPVIDKIVKDLYPVTHTWYNTKMDMNGSGVELFDRMSQDIQNQILPNIQKRISNIQDQLNKEGEDFNKKFGMFNSISEWKLKDHDIQSFHKYVEFIKKGG